MADPVQNNPQNLTGVDISQKAIHDNLFYTTPLKTAPAQVKETRSTKVERAKEVAKSKLKKKNRKRHRKNIVKPYDETVESGTVYAVSGSRSDVDGNWLVVNVTHNFSKGGATTAMELERCLPAY